MDQAKLDFICKDYVHLMNGLPAETKGKWGKMNIQQVVEHLADVFKISSGKLKLDLFTPVEHLPRYMDFLYSDKEFRENTKAPANILPEEPVGLRLPSMHEAQAELQNEINAFADFFGNNPGKKTLHPVFGELNFEEWVLFHYKHVTHHLRQFELM